MFSLKTLVLILKIMSDLISLRSFGKMKTTVKVQLQKLGYLKYIKCFALLNLKQTVIGEGKKKFYKFNLFPAIYLANCKDDM